MTFKAINDSQFMRGNIVPGCNIHGSLTGHFARINPACFTQPALGTFGTVGRNFLRQPGINNLDMGDRQAISAFPSVSSSYFKMDTFNTFNHHQYGGNVGGLIVAGSGGNAAISNTVGSSTFGQITLASEARDLQFSGRLTF